MLHLSTNKLGRATIGKFDPWEFLNRLLPRTIANWWTVFAAALYPNARLLHKTTYDAVIVSHPVDGDCTLFALAAARRGIPVVCLSMGIDNLRSLGPMLSAPDLLLLWSQVQAASMHAHQAVTPALRKTRLAVIGGLPHDRIVNRISSGAFLKHYPYIGKNTAVVMFAGYSERWYPRQVETCQVIVDMLKGCGRRFHLIVRPRPIGSDLSRWRQFAAVNADFVTIQHPEGMLFTKSGSPSALSTDQEKEELALFVETLTRSTVVIVGGLSTVFFDSIAAGTPSICFGISVPDGSMLNVVERSQAQQADIESMGRIELVQDYERLREQVLDIVVGDNKNVRWRSQLAIYRLQAEQLDGKAGERAAAAIEELLSSSGRGGGE